MALISEITEDIPDEEEGPTAAEKPKEEPHDEKPAEVSAEKLQGQPLEPGVEEPSKGGSSSAGQTLYNECALRVAYIMRSYLLMRQAGAPGHVQPAPPPPGGDRCRAMMEVVRKEHGRWVVSKLVVEHNHELLPGQVPDNGSQDVVLEPAVGVEFESVEAAKAFYYGYGEKSGFKARTGSNRRSTGSGALIMQRFLCWRGNYLMYRNNSMSSVGKRKRGPYKKRAHRPALEVVAAAAAKKDQDAMEVIEVESSTDKGEMTEKDYGGEVQSGNLVNAVVTSEKDVRPKPISSAGLATATIAIVKDGGKTNPATNTSQSRLLRALGVKVYRYTEKERRDIILKYLMKRTNRGIERPTKVSSRQALAESRRRGIGGRFLSGDEVQISSRQDETTEMESDAPTEYATNVGGEPKVGKVFPNEDKAYEFYAKYAGAVGFSVRKGWWDKSSRNVTRSRVYVCSREGYRPTNITNEPKKTRPETRTGCPARMAIKITPDGKYCVTEFVADHNHQLAAPLDIQMLRSQRLSAKFQTGGRQDASQIPASYKNYLRSKRNKDMQSGDAGALLEYFQQMKGDNPSFSYAIQVDENDQLTNVFWADPKSIMDYHYFGDVVCFDTTYRINGYGRPLVLFIGVNHHKQIIIFGAALLYDESLGSLKWLLETFKSTMAGKQPKTILTDHLTAISDAISAAWPTSTHRFCVWHIYQNAKKHLCHVFQGFETFAEDFGRCMYDCEEEQEFLSAWDVMLEKYGLKDNKWLDQLYEKKEKWALVYARKVFCADITNTLRNENLHIVLKDYLNPEIDLLSFFRQYEKLVEEIRYREQQADNHANQGTSRIPPLRLLWQAANTYTPAIFEMFRLEFELFMNCVVYSCEEVGTIVKYEVNFKEKTNAHFVTFDLSDGTVFCSCKKFEFVGVQCCHSLKVLDIRNIEELLPHYILKRWRKDAKAHSIRDNHNFALEDDPKSSLAGRCSSLCRILYQIALKAAENAETYSFIESQSDQLLEQVESLLHAKLLEKPALTTASKGQQQNLSQNESNSSESQRLNGKKKKNTDSFRRHQNVLDPNKRQKQAQGASDEALVLVGVDELPLSTENASNVRNASQFFAPTQFMQGSFVSGHQFGLSGVQGFHGIGQLNQDPSASALLQQPFHSGSQLTQNAVQTCPVSDVNALQFVGGNTQLGHQSSDQGHYTIPVWDFL